MKTIKLVKKDRVDKYVEERINNHLYYAPLSKNMRKCFKKDLKDKGQLLCYVVELGENGQNKMLYRFWTLDQEYFVDNYDWSVISQWDMCWHESYYNYLLDYVLFKKHAKPGRYAIMCDEDGMGPEFVYEGAWHGRITDDDNFIHLFNNILEIEEHKSTIF